MKTKNLKTIDFKKEYSDRTKLQKSYYWKNKEDRLKKANEYYRKNREKILKRTKNNYEDRKTKAKKDLDYREIYIKRLETIRLWHRERNRKDREDALRAFGKVECAKCGFSDRRALHIDHINGGGNQERKKFKDPNKYHKHICKNVSNYQLLCANCNFIKKHEEQEKRKSKNDWNLKEIS